jgi:hypothetical protein
MAQQRPQADGLFARGRELGPVLRDEIVEVEDSAFDEREGEGGEDSLSDRVGVYECVALPGLRLCSIGEAAPEIDYRASACADAECGADVGFAFGASEVRGECFANRFEARVAASVDRCGGGDDCFSLLGRTVGLGLR